VIVTAKDDLSLRERAAVNEFALIVVEEWDARKATPVDASQYLPRMDVPSPTTNAADELADQLSRAWTQHQLAGRRESSVCTLHRDGTSTVEPIE
jgi:hypothetical protein